MIAIEIVSEASAMGITAEREAAAQEREARQRVAEEECEGDGERDGAPLGPASAVPMTMPVTSPMAQPVRRWRVALSASASSSRPDVGSSR
jgi:hypothetical protein